MIDNLIYVKENAISSDQCQELIDFFENNPKYHTQGGVARLQFSKEMEGVTYKDLGMDKIKQCTEIYFSSKNLTSWQSDPESKKGKLFKELAMSSGSVLKEYVDKYSFLKTLPEWDISETFKMQKYLPNEAYWSLHCENDGTIDGHCERRMLAWMVYLNDVTDDGETEFPTQEIKFKPKTGSMLIWPAYWTHPHRGIPSPTQIKYILTGWFSFPSKESLQS